jgi:hypothetical protein
MSMMRPRSEAPSGVCCVLCGYEEDERDRKKGRKESSRGLYTLANLPNPPYFDFEKLLNPLYKRMNMVITLELRRIR